ncbi:MULTISPECIES: hypothetical protein [Kordiimonas]|jgi:hypothetical protein|uniref:hypothetical protein n=1 Tax=Kordiimonas TaxID=288021 RepID=UPI00257EA142|nr:hypothetical protein [Kordiimonas sp. UBA4487]
MDLGLTLGSLVAIIVLALLTAKLFPNTGRLDADRVARNIVRYAPEAQVADVMVDATGKVALAALDAPADCFGLARLLGDRVVCRLLTSADIRKVYKDHARITLVLNDFTQPEITLTMPAATLAQATKLLDGFANREEATHAA